MGIQLPRVGNWYKDLETDLLFEVVAVEEDSGTIEVQFSEGELSGFDVESWSQLLLTQVSPPEDANIAYEMSIEDNWGGDVDMHMGLTDPLSAIEPDLFQGTDEF